MDISQHPNSINTIISVTAIVISKLYAIIENTAVLIATELLPPPPPPPLSLLHHLHYQGIHYNNMRKTNYSNDNNNIHKSKNIKNPKTSTITVANMKQHNLREIIHAFNDLQRWDIFQIAYNTLN